MNKQKQKVDKSVLIAAIAGLVVLEVAAMYKGINGTMFSIIVAAIAGLAGWSLPQLKVK